MSQRNPSPGPDAHPSALSRRTLLAATAAALPAGAVALSAAPALADPTVDGGETRVVDVQLADAELVETDGAQARELPEQPATMVGVTWPHETDAPEVQVRGRLQEGGWTEWVPLETAEDPETGEDAPGTEAAWIGVVDALQVRAELDGADVTEGLTAHVITTSPAAEDRVVEDTAGAPEPMTLSAQQSTARTAQATTMANPATPVLGPGAPTYTSRAGWGADESLVRGTSAANQLKAVVIHHTAGTNSYTAAQSAEIVRGILVYHTKTLGWADIGYNMLVSKYGQVFEGRSGGLHRNIVGAHAYGFNTGSFGISVMGDYQTTAVPSAARAAVARLVGWKLLSTFQTKVTATSSWTPGEGTRFPAGKTISLPKMFGHRDVNYTECPGDALYKQFGTLRSEAQKALDGGWKDHLNAFTKAGGASKLGTVVRSAHENGPFASVTILTKGLVLQGTGAATGYATPFADEWTSDWRRPEGAAFTRAGQTVQRFQRGAAVRMNGRTVFHDSRFIDVPPNLMYRAEIEALASKGITEGWSDGTFRPLSEIQRDAMVVFVYRALGSPAFTEPTKPPFTDMPRGRQFYKEIAWAKSEGIVEGWKDGTFRPTAPVERGAVAAFLYRASGATSTSTSNSFKDVPRTHQFAKEITWLASTGITTGWPDGTFRPVASITRDAMAAFMIRWMKHQGL
jgi:hypothetical protein